MKRVALVVIVLCLVSVPDAQQGNKAKAQKLKSKLSSMSQKKKEVKAKLHTVKKQVWVVAADVDQLDDRINVVVHQLAETKSKLDDAQEDQAVLKRDLAIAQKKLKACKDVAARRIRSIYVSGNETVLSVLIGSRSVADFATRKSLLERIAKHDHELFSEVKVLRDQVADKKLRQDQVVERIAGLKEKQTGQQLDLKSAMSEKKQVLNQLRSQRDQLEEELEAMERESNRIEAQIRAYMRTNSGKVSPYKGRFMIPVNGRFSSPYGYRIHPISHVRKLHTGQDIAAPMGTTIRAAGPGVVISTGWRGGYGNTVIIDHGGGISTLYGHCSRVFARAGQKVSAGTPIAAVGTTGYSTGPHVHFEVRVNGRPVNPRPYL